MVVCPFSFSGRSEGLCSFWGATRRADDVVVGVLAHFSGYVVGTGQEVMGRSGASWVRGGDVGARDGNASAGRGTERDANTA